MKTVEEYYQEKVAKAEAFLEDTKGLLRQATERSNTAQERQESVAQFTISPNFEFAPKALQNRFQLEQDVEVVGKAFLAAKKALSEFNAKAENNVFESLGEAELRLEDILRFRAFQDCEGANNCGADQYKQEFIVEGKKYLATLTLDYNRYDKTYYYINKSWLEITEIV